MSDVSLEELQKIIEAASVEKNKRANKKRNSGESRTHWTVENFIKDQKIISGPTRVPTSVIYYTYYKKWVKYSTTKKTNKIIFFKTFSNYFKSVRTGKQRYYLVEAECFDLSREGILEAKHYEEINKKTNKKKQSKVPKSFQKPKSEG